MDKKNLETARDNALREFNESNSKLEKAITDVQNAEKNRSTAQSNVTRLENQLKTTDHNHQEVIRQLNLNLDQEKERLRTKETDYDKLIIERDKFSKERTNAQERLNKAQEILLNADSNSGNSFGSWGSNSSSSRSSRSMGS